MTPEKTNFITQGYDGLKRLKQGPMLDSYRGLSIVHSRQYSLETGAPPRDLLRRRVRTAEFYRIPPLSAIGNPDSKNVMIDLYDESKDTFFTTSWKELLNHAALDETDIARFENLGNEITADDHGPGAPQFDVFSGDDGRIMIVRLSTESKPGAAPADTASVQAAVAPDTYALTDQKGSGLVLRTASISGRDSISGADARKKEEVRSFYRSSGFFNATYSSPVVRVAVAMKRLCMYGHTMSFNPFKKDIHLFNAPPGTDKRKVMFRKLILGDTTETDGAAVTDDKLDFNTSIGMRPNLHIGQMVFANQRPDTMRFVHVAAHVLAQTVVTRGVAVRLMQNVFQPKEMDDKAVGSEFKRISKAIRYMYGLDKTSLTVAGMTLDGDGNLQIGEATDKVRRYYTVETSVLAVMTAAVMHPDVTTRQECATLLKQKVDLDVQNLGETLVTWMRVFLNAIPVGPNQESPAFDAYEQGLVLDTTFKTLIPQDPERGSDGVVTDDLRNLIPVMYLGSYVKKASAVTLLRKAGSKANSDDMYLDVPMTTWADGESDLAMHRDVNDSTFQKRRAYVFPNGKEAVRPQDLIAVTRSANPQDVLVAFTQIMSKRFFSSYPHMYVEEEPNANLGKPNPAVDPASLGTTRRALTSNDYPEVVYGPKDQFNSKDEWEIVVIRPQVRFHVDFYTPHRAHPNGFPFFPDRAQHARRDPCPGRVPGAGEYVLGPNRGTCCWVT
jgi:hypothetical protein